MTEHHGLDLEAIQKALGSHSIFAPSSSAMWLTCSGSLIPNLLAEDDAGYDAAEGTVGHEVAQEWLERIAEDDDREDIDALLDRTQPNYLVGKIRTVVEPSATFKIEITAEMIGYIREYVQWCMELPGVHYIEERVDFSKVTPIPNQKGTCDHAACRVHVLTGTDLKYGKGVEVSAALHLDNPAMFVDGKLNGNSQVLLYILGFFYAFDHIYDFQEIIIRIAQPRRNHWETWTTTREELLKFADWVKERAALAWNPHAERTPSKYGCQWCKVKPTCAALANFLQDGVEGVFDDLDTIEGEFKVISTGAERSYDLLPSDPRTLTTEQMAKLLPYRKLIEKFFTQMETELTWRANNGEMIPGWKLVDGREGNREWALPEEEIAAELEFLGCPEDKIYVRKLASPARAEESIKAAARLKGKAAANLISHLTTRAPGKPTLAPDNDKRLAREDAGSVFDDLDADL